MACRALAVRPRARRGSANPKLIEPDCDAEIAYSDITARGMVQHPVFKTLLTGMQE